MSTPEFWVGPVDDPDLISLGPAVASGAEGVLYRATFPLEEGAVEVAVKMLQPGHLDQLRVWTARWREQVELLSKVAVPGLVGVRGGFVGPLPHPRGRADSTTSSLYLVMDWVEGVPLDRWARAVEATEPEQLLLTLVPVAAALDLLHSGAATGGTPVIHRDVKPANILMRPGGDTVLVDVGSARGIVDESRPSGVVGTPGYIAPEVRADGDYGPASDRYALAAVAFFLLTGEEPPIDADHDELRGRLVAAPVLQGRPELVDHVLEMLDPNPDVRPASLANWVAQLRRSSLAALPGDVVLAPRAAAREASSKAADPHLRRSRLTPRRVAVSLIVAVAVAGVAVVVMLRLGRDDGTGQLTAASSSSKEALAPWCGEPSDYEGWTTFDPGPLSTRGGPPVVWTGREMFVIGGYDRDGPRGPIAFNNGAAYNPATRKWRRIASRADLPPGPVSVWTEGEIMMWGLSGRASDPVLRGHAYNVAKNEWRRVASAPSPPGAGAWWTGREVLFFGSGSGALYDPEPDSWRPMPVLPLPSGLDLGQAVWAGSELVVVASTPHDNGPVADRLFLFDPRKSTWRAGAPPPQGRRLNRPVWTGKAVVMLRSPDDPPATTLIYDVANDRWRESPGGTTVDAPLVVMNDGRVVVLTDRVEVYDPRADQWDRTAIYPCQIKHTASLVAIGDSVIAWGAQFDHARGEARSDLPNGAWEWKAPRQGPAAISLSEDGPPPWAAEPVRAGAGRDVLIREWSNASNRASSRGLLPAATGLSARADPRRADFAGGWAVAWDDPGKPGSNSDGSDCASCGRGVVGVAGTGTEGSATDVAQQNAHIIRWSDGSVLGYGPRNNDPSSVLVGSLVIAGQPRLYQVWSYLGEEHLKYLVSQLRFVAGAP